MCHFICLCVNVACLRCVFASLRAYMCVCFCVCVPVLVCVCHSICMCHYVYHYVFVSASLFVSLCWCILRLQNIIDLR